MTLRQAIRTFPIVRIVVDALGEDEEEAFDTLRNVAEHGADAGFPGFTYYSDTCAFASSYRSTILAQLREDAAEFGQESAIQFVKGFRCLNDDYSEDEIGTCLYGNGLNGDDDAACAIGNALAWYALERAAQYVAD